MPDQPGFEALVQVRQRLNNARGQAEYQGPAGIEGTLSQAVRRSGLRRARYRGLANTHLHHVAAAVALNAVRTVNHLQEKTLAHTRHSRFAR